MCARRSSREIGGLTSTAPRDSSACPRQAYTVYLDHCGPNQYAAVCPGQRRQCGARRSLTTAIRSTPGRRSPAGTARTRHFRRAWGVRARASLARFPRRGGEATGVNECECAVAVEHGERAADADSIGDSRTQSATRLLTRPAGACLGADAVQTGRTWRTRQPIGRRSFTSVTDQICGRRGVQRRVERMLAASRSSWAGTADEVIPKQHAGQDIIHATQGSGASAERVQSVSGHIRRSGLSHARQRFRDGGVDGPLLEMLR